MADTAPRVFAPGEAVEARFVCERKDLLDQTSVSVTLRASITGADNKEWAPYTPAGSLIMTVTGQAAGAFVQGDRYAVTLRRLGPGE